MKTGPVGQKKTPSYNFRVRELRRTKRFRHCTGRCYKISNLKLV
jgi:hypothetical protein